MNLNEAFKILSSEKVQKLNEIGYTPFIGLFLIVFITSFFLIFIYNYFYGHKTTGAQLYRSFPLLLMSITGIFLGLQFSIPLSLGLLGALSIVRFRTPVKEAEEVAFVLILISLSLCFATFNFKFAAIILIFSILALFILNKTKFTFLARKQGGNVLLSLTTEKYQETKEQIFASINNLGKNYILEGVTSNKENTSISVNFIQLNENQIPLIIKEFTNIDKEIFVNIYFNKSNFF